ncbi:hypothetical protein PM082_003174 [Marasmius tenuissimus]|nr:hypothetical protein PM082_003174 [Marasmius tenuissimus]
MTMSSIPVKKDRRRRGDGGTNGELRYCTHDRCKQLTICVTFPPLSIKITGIKGFKQASVKTRKQESLELDPSDEDEAEFTPDSSECESPQSKRKLRNKNTNVKRKEKSHIKTQGRAQVTKFLDRLQHFVALNSVKRRRCDDSDDDYKDVNSDLPRPVRIL